MENQQTPEGKTLDKCKDEVAKEHEHDTFESFRKEMVYYGQGIRIIEATDQANKMYYDQFIKKDEQTLTYAQELAKSIAKRCYPECPQFEVLEDLYGVISQIDNMSCGMDRKKADANSDA